MTSTRRIPFTFLGTVFMCTLASYLASQPHDLKAQAPPQKVQRVIKLDPTSVRSLLLTLFSNSETIGSATGFIVEKSGHPYLVTNWHVLHGRRPDNQQVMDPNGRVPDSVGILQNAKGHLGMWVAKVEPLSDASGKSRIIDHPDGPKVDIVALPLADIAQVEVYPVDLESRNIPILLAPTSPVSVVGFPFGHASYSGLPIWKSGTIASDPDVDYESSPQFLIDATARPGMSGSPVYARRVGTFVDEAGGTVAFGGTADKFLGVFAGSIDGGSEVGRVWKAQALLDLLAKVQ